MGIYLSLVVLSVLVTAVLMSTVVMHRSFFQRRIKYQLVRNSDLLLRWTLVLVGLILIGTLALVFDLVLGGWAGAVAAGAAALVLLLPWIVLPQRSRRLAAFAGNSKAAPDTAAGQHPQGCRPAAVMRKLVLLDCRLVGGRGLQRSKACFYLGLLAEVLERLELSVEAGGSKLICTAHLCLFTADLLLETSRPRRWDP